MPVGQSVRLGVSALAAAILLGSSHAVVAAQGTFRLAAPHGVEMDCKAWLKGRADPTEPSKMREAWVLGFLTASNLYYDPQQGLNSTLTNDSLFEGIDKYCAQAPQAQISDGLMWVIHQELDHRRGLVSGTAPHHR